MRQPYAVLIFAVLLIASLGPLSYNAAAQCYSCANEGTSCNASLPGPYESCGCPCACSGACDGGSTEIRRADLLPSDEADHDEVLAMIPDTGAILDEAPSSEMLSNMDNGIISDRVDDSLFFSDNFALVRYGDDSWRAFPLESPNSFVIRGCEGEFISRVERLTPLHYLAKRQNT